MGLCGSGPCHHWPLLLWRWHGILEALLGPLRGRGSFGKISLAPATCAPGLPKAEPTSAILCHLSHAAHPGRTHSHERWQESGFGAGPPGLSPGPAIATTGTGPRLFAPVHQRGQQWPWWGGVVIAVFREEPEEGPHGSHPEPSCPGPGQHPISRECHWISDATQHTLCRSIAATTPAVPLPLL